MHIATIREHKGRTNSSGINKKIRPSPERQKAKFSSENQLVYYFFCVLANVSGKDARRIPDDKLIPIVKGYVGQSKRVRKSVVI